ncbi:MAG: class I SAM-dependent methyltransferase [Asgard group archaeon]|nr:class I SAM-dependent methyltransferase [Asgard group archaeon]
MNNNEQHEHDSSMDRYKILEKQHPEVDFVAEGFVLDIGGGGEGIIGQYLGNQIISIDRNQRELEEAPSENLKIIMDATDLKFLDNTFATAAAFFTLMYMDDSSRKKTLNEAYRVLKQNGELHIWDVTITPKTADDPKEFIVVPIQTIIKDKEINTGYGVRRIPHNLKYYINLCKEIGFSVIFETEKDQIFYLRLKK